MAHLSQKRYEEIAKVIRDAKTGKSLDMFHDAQGVYRAALCLFAGLLCDYFAKQDRKFNRDKFLEQAGFAP